MKKEQRIYKRDKEKNLYFKDSNIIILRFTEDEIRKRFADVASKIMEYCCFTYAKPRSIIYGSIKHNPVFNLQVEDDESYIANGVVVHNCAYCKAKHGKHYNINDINEMPPLHPRCRCRLLPSDIQLDIKVKKDKEGKVVTAKLLPTPANYKYVVKLKKSEEDIDLEKAEVQVKSFGRVRRGRYELVKPFRRKTLNVGGREIPLVEDITKRIGWEPFYSTLEKLVNEKFPNAMPGNQLKAFLVNHGVKEEEIKWTQMDQLFNRPRVTKDEIRNWVAENSVKLTELVKTR